MLNPLGGSIITAKLRSERGCGTAVNSGTRSAAPAAARFLCECRSSPARCDAAHHRSLPAALIKTLTSSVSDRSTASISNESSGDATRGRLPGSLPSGSRPDGAPGRFKIVISPSGQKEVDPLCTWRPGSIYCSQVSVLLSFISPFDCPHCRRGSISTASVASHTCCFCISKRC